VKYFELTNEEKKILADFEKGNLISVKDVGKLKTPSLRE
jgi:hypothetical protein